MRVMTLSQGRVIGLVLASLTMISIGLNAPSQAGDLQDLWRNPMVKHAVIGATAGGAAGALTDRTTVGKGALVGGLTGVGSGALNRIDSLDRRPLVKSALRGAIIGTGAGYVTDSGKAKGALIGAGVGAGAHYVRDYLRDY